ncbi:DUF6163 family protein [Phreatobacter oligotrophus]|uniref:DoxX family protein n=1 Tax=Phreatobacter oligotrophus TaxID=1122261 RepID=A0A2T4ZHV4_9HYPH|nr:DUF6163 family protein [Phreatobacter oligotrophus]MBX9989615.1 hypothetical protein [Phreatobacter oligotrophus]PTM61555.1 hypothetical protein C8P69_101225 [Phreatobacter oligotrophus]
MSAARLRTASDAPIPADGEARGIDWTRIYRIFMRALAVMTIARGLSQWLVICGGPNADGLGFEELPPGLQASTVFFAVIELVAGVGLWLTSAWGGVVWILATAVAVAIDLAMMGGMQGWVQLAARAWPATAADAALLFFYAIVAVLAARQADHTSTE